MYTFTYNSTYHSTRPQPSFHDRPHDGQAERLAGEEDDRSDIELMDDDDEKNEAEESDPLTLTEILGGFWDFLLSQGEGAGPQDAQR